MLLKSYAMQASFAHLIKLYTTIISVMVVLSTTVFVTVSIRTYDADVEQAENTAIVQVGQMLNQNQQIAAQFATQMKSSSSNLPSIENILIRLSLITAIMRLIKVLVAVHTSSGQLSHGNSLLSMIK